MEDITIGQIAAFLAFVVGLAGSIKYLKNELDKSIVRTLNPVNQKIESVELMSIKADLVNFINDVELGNFKSHIQRMNAHELYDRYVELGGNSYVKEHWKKLEEEGKI